MDFELNREWRCLRKELKKLMVFVFKLQSPLFSRDSQKVDVERRFEKRG